MSEVLLASHLDAPHRRVALKRALPSFAGEPTIQRSLEREARRLAQVTSPHVVRLLGAEETRGGLVLVLELVEGVPLSFLLQAEARRGERLGLPERALLLEDLLRGLAAIHETREQGQALVHGDLTPRNVLIGFDGVARLCDLGLSSREGEQASGAFQGSAAYTAPERWEQGVQSQRGDVFAAGVVLWEGLRGERLFAGAGVLAALQRVAEAPIPALEEGHPELQRWSAPIREALEREPARRLPSGPALLARWGATERPERSAVGVRVRALVSPWLGG
jgi:serine/threonine-protein kinase